MNHYTRVEGGDAHFKLLATCSHLWGTEPQEGDEIAWAWIDIESHFVTIFGFLLITFCKLSTHTKTPKIKNHQIYITNGKYSDFINLIFSVRSNDFDAVHHLSGTAHSGDGTQ